MIPLILTALIATPADNLAALIRKRQPRATYAAELAQRIVVEGKRHGVKPAWLAAVAWGESHFDRDAKGRHGEYGVFQTQVNETGIDDYWDWIRSNPAGFPLASKWGAIPWRNMGHRRPVVLRSMAAGTYIAVAAIKAHSELCRRMGHRIGKPRCYPTPGGTRCIRRHVHAIDRLGHYHSGSAWPRAWYVNNLRRRARIVARWMHR